jgi:hypothetical protein
VGFRVCILGPATEVLPTLTLVGSLKITIGVQ